MITSGAWLKVVAPLRERDFRLLWSGNLVSLLGDGIFTVALALEALRVDHQPTGLAYVLACRAVPAVALAIVGGVVVDRIPRRTAVLVADLVRGAAVGSSPFWWSSMPLVSGSWPSWRSRLGRPTPLLAQPFWPSYQNCYRRS